MYRKLKDKHKHTHSRCASKNRHKKISLKKNKILHGEKKENEIVVYEDKELSQGKLISFIQKQRRNCTYKDHKKCCPETVVLFLCMFQSLLFLF